MISNKNNKMASKINGQRTKTFFKIDRLLRDLTSSMILSISSGASPRASIGLVLASKARALLDGRKFVSRNDINEMALPILRHRIILNFEAERQGLSADDVIKKLLK